MYRKKKKIRVKIKKEIKPYIFSKFMFLYVAQTFSYYSLFY